MAHAGAGMGVLTVMIVEDGAVSMRALTTSTANALQPRLTARCYRPTERHTRREKRTTRGPSRAMLDGTGRGPSPREFIAARTAQVQQLLATWVGK